MLLYANNLVKFMPIDKTSMDMLSPIIDYTHDGDRSFMESLNDVDPTRLGAGFCGETRRIGFFFSWSGIFCIIWCMSSL
jgi:hypothetical protein